MAIIVALLASVAATMVAFNRVDHGAAKMFAPYLAWVAFATVLNAGYSYLNSAMFAFLR